MKTKVFAGLGLLLGAAVLTLGADGKWTGYISDSACGACRHSLVCERLASLPNEGSDLRIGRDAIGAFNAMEPNERGG